MDIARWFANDAAIQNIDATLRRPLKFGAVRALAIVPCVRLAFNAAPPVLLTRKTSPACGHHQCHRRGGQARVPRLLPLVPILLEGPCYGGITAPKPTFRRCISMGVSPTTSPPPRWSEKPSARFRWRRVASEPPHAADVLPRARRRGRAEPLRVPSRGGVLARRLRFGRSRIVSEEGHGRRNWNFKGRPPGPSDVISSGWSGRVFTAVAEGLRDDHTRLRWTDGFSVLGLPRLHVNRGARKRLPGQGRVTSVPGGPC